MYFVTTLDRKLCKLGWSRDPHRRYREIQAMFPRPVEILGQIPGEKALEQRLHRHFWGLRTHPQAEWFEVKGRLLALLEKLNLVEVPYVRDLKYSRMARALFWDLWTDEELDRLIEHPEEAIDRMYECKPGWKREPLRFPEIDGSGI